MKHLVLAISSLAFIGCEGSAPQPATEGPAERPQDSTLVAAGESRDSLQRFLAYDFTSVAADEGGRTPGSDLCSHALFGGTTAIVEVLAIDPISLGVPVCDRDHGPGASLYQVSVLGNAGPAALPTNFTMAYIFFGWQPDAPPEVGDLGLVTMREDAGEWLALMWLPLQISETRLELELRSGEATDLPDTFPVLAQELAKRSASYGTYCSYPTADEQHGPWPTWARDPAYWHESCRAGYVQEDVGEPYPPRSP